MYRDILVHVKNGTNDRERVLLAADLAERTGAHLHGLHVTPPAEAAPVYKPSAVEDATAQLAARLVREADAAQTCFNAITAPQLSNFSWFSTEGDIATGICNQARYADLVIVGQLERQGPAERHPLPISHAVVLHCGRPVLVVPPDVRRLELAKVAIAWDGSTQAVRAVHDAIPLLCKSGIVQIVTVSPFAISSYEDDTRKLATHLANHGINVEIPAENAMGVAEISALRSRIEREHCDLLVMGGYSHPQWLEFIFGGTTHSMLSSSAIPILVSH